MKKIKLTTIIFAICCVSFLAFLAFNPSHAYFQSHAQATGVNTAKVDLLFDKFTPNQEVEGDNTTKGNYTYGSFSGNINNDPWGTIKNPYVMTGKNHVNNLFILQRSGYFAKKTETDGTTPRQSYFVVSNKNGTPVVIDCNGMTINPIGSATNPFTGNIQGAPLTGTAEYGNYTVSQSTIANLNVVAVESTPDIGFFGRLGHVGEPKKVVVEEEDNAGNVISSSEVLQLDGFAASLDNLLFADITISTEQAPGTDWWSKFTDNDKPHDECGETHHLGIIAGHAEWASITNISVYYSEGIPAFDVGKDTTNYYSIVGLLGTLSYVNPTPGSTAGTVTEIGSVSDEQLKEDLLTGGGGQGSGMLTGYMLAENIFDRKDDSNEMTTLDYYAEAYDVKSLTEKGAPIFTKVTMMEKQSAGATEVYKNYYYFSDAIFTFAMTTYVEATNEQGDVAPGATSTNTDTDYIIKIWDLTDANRPPFISLTKSKDDWTGGVDQSKTSYIYEFSAVSSLPNDVGSEKTFVLAYNAGTVDNPSFYFLDILGGETSGFSIPISPYIFDSNPNDEITEYGISHTGEGTAKQIDKFYALDTSNTVFSYSFLYNYDSEGDRNVRDTHYETVNLAMISALSTGRSAFGFFVPMPGPGSHNFGDGKLFANSVTDDGADGAVTDLCAYHGDSDLKWFSWDIKRSSTEGAPSNAFTVSGDLYEDTYTWGWNSTYYVAYFTQLVFNTDDKIFNVLQSHSSPDRDLTTAKNDRTTLVPKSNEKTDFLIFEVKKVEADALKTENILPESDSKVIHSFDPSTDILFCNPAVKEGQTQLTTTQIAATRNYTVTPILAKKWNNGKGQYLSELNHLVKLAKGTTSNLQTNFSDAGLNEWFDRFNTNTGGVVLAPLGTTGLNFTLPAGTIAFYINKASETEPSQINIIVAAEPGISDAPTIGLFGQEIGTGRTTFNLNDPDQAFALPVSRVPISPEIEAFNEPTEEENAAILQAIPYVNISGYYTYDETTKEYTPINQSAYTFLGGELAFVGCTFEVTDPGVYLLAPITGKMSVAYFSVDGAAGSGGDGTGGSPLGDIDFVYDNGANKILTVDQKFDGTHIVSGEDLNAHYYPSYYYIRMIPDADYKSSGESDPLDGKIPSEKLYIRRYIVAEPPKLNPNGTTKADRRRVIKLTATDPDTKLLGLSAIYQDVDYATIYPTT